jgi:hypothetical protein
MHQQKNVVITTMELMLECEECEEWVECEECTKKYKQLKQLTLLAVFCFFKNFSYNKNVLLIKENHGKKSRILHARSSKTFSRKYESLKRMTILSCYR